MCLDVFTGAEEHLEAGTSETPDQDQKMIYRALDRCLESFNLSNLGTI